MSTDTDAKYCWSDGTPIRENDIIITKRGALIVIDEDCSIEYFEGCELAGILCKPANIVSDAR